MTIGIGTRFGPYEIVAPLGAGGMGEVYKARDTRLDRIVAIKILPVDVAQDEQRRERFRREARAISSLAHPHICTLYDVGEQNGIDFLVMECLTGETLAHRLLRGALPLPEALRIAEQLADGLDVAHRQGLIHRDLKPANVMVTTGGAKILDFGLAKWQEIERQPAMSTAALTAHPALTQVGTVIGTLQYMSPEQVEGRPTDARSDLFALGAILYEMTTGKKAFEGTSPSDVMAAILTVPPPPMATFQPVTPRALERLVTKALAKDPVRRWQTAADLRDELAWVAEVLAKPSTGAAAASSRWQRVAYYSIAATVAMAALIGLLVFEQLGARSPDSRLVRLFIPAPEGVRYSSFGSTQGPPVISPDGRQVAFIAHGTDNVDLVWVRPLDDVTARALPGTNRAAPQSAPFWSPDSKSIGFFAEGKLKRIDVVGGPPLVLTDAPTGRGGAWNDRGTILFAPGIFSPLFQVAATGGRASPATKLRAGEDSHRWPAFLPDGRHFLYFNRRLSEADQSGTDVGSLDSPEVKRVLSSAYTVTNVAYASGQLLFARRSTLFAAPFDPDRLTLTGSPATVAENVAPEQAPGQGYLAPFSVSSNGVLTYRQPGAPLISQLEWFDRAGGRIGTMGSSANQGSPSLSPDGTRVAIIRDGEIWVLGGGSADFRLTFDAAAFTSNVGPIWSPDARWIAFGHAGVTARALFRKPAGGIGDAEALVSGYTPIPTDWSHDGRFVVYSDYDPKSGLDLWALPLQGDRQRIPLVRTDGADAFGQLSPDGRWLAYSSDVTGRSEVYIQRFPTALGKIQVSTKGGREPRWRRDGKELYYVAEDTHLTVVSLSARDQNLDVQTQQAAFDIHLAPFSDGDVSSYSVSPDGQRFLINTTVSEPMQPIVVLLNWPAALKK